MGVTAGHRRTQQSRREETRRALLEATVASLLEVGYARTTTLEVQKRAGVSRGALLHHFPSKASLLAAAVEHVVRVRGADLERRLGSLPRGGGRAAAAAALDLLWAVYTDPYIQVSIELWSAARTDAELRAALAGQERAFGRTLRARCRQAFGDEAVARPGFDEAVDVTLQLLRGAALTSIMRPGAEHFARLREVWGVVLARWLGPAGAPGATTEGEGDGGRTSI
jgi:AcrR family transcriptional regulator